MEWEAAEKEALTRKAKGIYFLHGEESYFIDRVVNAFEKKFLDESQTSFDQSVFYGKDADPSVIIDAARRFPLLADQQLVIVKEAQNMKELDQLASYVKNPSERTVLVIAYMHRKMKMTSALAKALKANGKVILTKSIYDNQAPGWIESYLKKNGFGIEDPKITFMLAEYLGVDLSKIVNELEKLMLNLKKGSKVTFSDVETYIGISREYNVFELQKALGFRDVITTQRIVENFKQNMKQPLFVLVGTIATYFSKLLMIKQMHGSSEKEIMSTIGVGHSFFLKEYHRSARNYSVQGIENILLMLHDYDLKSKGVEYNLTNHPQEGLLQEMTWSILETK